MYATSLRKAGGGLTNLRLPVTRAAWALVAVGAMAGIAGCGGSTSPTGVIPVPAPTISSFAASANSINVGQSSTLTWATVNATSVTLTGVTGSATSPVTVSPTVTTDYTLTATNATGSVSQTVTIIVNPVGFTLNTTSTPMPRGQIFDLFVTNSSVYAGRVSFIWGASHILQPVPAVPSAYIPYSRDPNHASVANHTLAWYVANHPTWVVYQCDASGNPLLPTTAITSTAYDFLYGTAPNQTIDVPLDITNPDVRTYYFNSFVLPLIQQGWPVIALDNIGLTNHDARCGVYDATGKWVRQYTGVQNANDPAYVASVLSWVQSLVGQIHANNVGVVGNLTFPANTSSLLPSLTQLINTVDIWIDETGFTGHQDANVNDAAWLLKFNFVRQNSGRYYVPINRTTTGTTMLSPPPAGAPTATPASQSQIDWAVANYLLYRESHTLLSVTGGEDYGYFVDAPALNVNLGTASAAPFQTSSSVWERVYSGGIVLVNPSSTQSGTVTLPSTMTDTHGKVYAGQITVVPNSGVMLKP